MENTDAQDTNAEAEDPSGANLPESDAAPTPAPLPGRAFLSDGGSLTLLEGVPWDSRRLRAILSVALGDERLTGEGAFAVVPGRHPGAYTARRLGALPPHAPVVLRVVLCDGRWIAVGPAGTEPREVFGDGRSRAWDGPVPVEALA